MTPLLDKLAYRFFCFLLITFPYVYGLNYIWPLSDKICVYLVINYLLVYIILLINALIGIELQIFKAAAYLTSVFLLSILLKVCFFGTDAVGVAGYLVQFTSFSLLILVAIYRNRFSKKIHSVFIYNLVLSAVIGVAHNIFFKEVLLEQTAKDAFLNDTNGYGAEYWAGRETGILLSSNSFSYFVVLGFLYLYVSIMYKEKARLTFKEIVFGTVIVWAVLLSRSRMPLLFIFYCTTMIMWHISMKNKKNIWVFPLFWVAVPLLYFYGSTGLSTTRLSDNGIFDVVRLDKDLLALKLLCSNWLYFLIGAPDQVVATSSGVNGIVFSDNSILTLFLDFGFFGGGIMSIIIYRLLRLFSIHRNKMIVFFVFVMLFVTNSILWNFWFFYAIMLCCLGGKIANPHKKNSQISCVFVPQGPQGGIIGGGKLSSEAQ